MDYASQIWGFMEGENKTNISRSYCEDQRHQFYLQAWGATWEIRKNVSHWGLQSRQHIQRLATFLLDEELKLISGEELEEWVSENTALKFAGGGGRSKKIRFREQTELCKGVSMGDEGWYENFGLLVVPEVNKVVRKWWVFFKCSFKRKCVQL